MKIMAIDYGDARTGVAISDALGWMTGQTAVIHSWKPEKTAEEVARMFKASGAQRLVMGFPRNMDGTEGPRAALPRLCRAFGADSRDKARFVGRAPHDHRGASDPERKQLSRQKTQKHGRRRGGQPDFRGLSGLSSQSEGVKSNVYRIYRPDGRRVLGHPVQQ